MWRRHAEQDSGLFGDPEIPALATVDHKNQVALLAAVRSDPRALGFAPDSPELHPGQFSADVPDGKSGKKVVTLERTDEDIARVCRLRLRKLLHKKFFELEGHSALAQTAFNPSRVVTASGRWKDYSNAVGGDKKALATVQELMAGDVSARFAAAYQQQTGKKLAVADRTLLHADKHAQAMLPQEMRQEEEGSPKALQALLQKVGPGGRFGTGEVKSRLEAAQAAAAGSQLDLLDSQEEGTGRSVSTSRPSIGKMAEGALAQMLPHMDVNRAQEAASDVTFADENGVKLQRAIRLMLENKRQGNNLFAGSGKAQPLDAKILTPSGWTTMGKIKVGDRVISVDGKATEVLGVFPQGKKEIYRVLFSDGSSTECCEEHLWLTSTSYERSALLSAINRKTENKYPGSKYDLTPYLPKVRTLGEIKETLVVRDGRKNHSVPVVKPVEYDALDIPLHPYLIGILLGDGSFRGAGPTLSSNDEFIVKLVNDLLPDTCGLTRITGSSCDWRITGRGLSIDKKVETKRGSYMCVLNVNPVRHYLAVCGLWNRASESKFIPPEYLYNDIPTRIALLQGLMDSDGYVSESGTAISFCTCSYELLQDFIELVRSLGGLCTYRERHPRYVYKGELRTGKTAFEANVILPPDIEPFLLPRKAKRVRPRTKYVPTRYIVGVEPIGAKEAQCISVAHESHLYVTDDFIVTHNTLATLAAFTQAHHDGDVRRMLYVTPSNVVEQVGGECWKFLDPSAGFQWYANGGGSGEDRRDAMSNGDNHVMVTTAESLREDITHAVAQDLGISKADAVEKLGSLDDDGRDALIHAAMDKRGWDFDFTCFDEGHRLLGRSGKPDAHMALVGDSVGRKASHYVYSTADIVKNDPSECWSALNKIAPDRYGAGTKDGFMRRFGRDTRAARAALQREVEPYLYSERTKFGVGLDNQVHILPLSSSQQERYDTVQAAYQQARQAKTRGGVDLQALAQMFPEKFTGDPAIDQETGLRLNAALGAVRDSALARVIHSSEGAKGDAAVDMARRHVERGDAVTVFAHNLETVQGIAQRLGSAGLRVATMTGSMSGREKARAAKAFSPSGDTPAQADVIVLSDAGAMGVNLPRGNVQIQVDTPQTAMLAHQRTGRNYRRGQKRDVQVHHLVADCPMEHQARKRLASKDDLREIMNSPAEEIDDSGLLLDIERARMQRAEKGA